MSSIPRTTQQQVAERSQYRCSYCQSQQRLMGVSLTVDHIIPQSLGGATKVDNLCLVTIMTLKLNRSQLVEARRYWARAGWHPPEPA
ncbi:MAG: HNH endonuclease [Anaerolineales bacterium]|nr:HNH endonuclease [Anaerolineales bacterium]